MFIKGVLLAMNEATVNWPTHGVQHCLAKATEYLKIRALTNTQEGLSTPVSNWPESRPFLPDDHTVRLSVSHS